MEAFLKALKEYLSSLQRTSKLLASATEYKERLEEYLTEVVKNSNAGSFSFALHFYEEGDVSLTLYIRDFEVYFSDPRPFYGWLPEEWKKSQAGDTAGMSALFTLARFLEGIPKILEQLRELEEQEYKAQQAIKDLLNKIRKAISPFLVSEALSDLEEDIWSP